MLTYEQAKEIGRNACIYKLGRDFVRQHRDNSSAAFGDRGDYIYCFVGVSNTQDDELDDKLILTSENQFPFIARCTVSYLDGAVDFLECVLP